MENQILHGVAIAARGQNCLRGRRPVVRADHGGHDPRPIPGTALGDTTAGIDIEEVAGLEIVRVGEFDMLNPPLRAPYSIRLKPDFAGPFYRRASAVQTSCHASNSGRPYLVSRKIPFVQGDDLTLCDFPKTLAIGRLDVVLGPCRDKSRRALLVHRLASPNDCLTAR